MLQIRLTVTPTCLLLIASIAPAQYQIDWYTIDGGGAMNSSNGQPNGLELSGTIGQHDASSPAVPMTGGAFELVGGFWPVAALTCACLGDMNADGAKDGRDIQQFVDCVLNGGACACADVNGAGGVTPADVPVFVSALLAGEACP
jgi:hypothetical protein